MCSDRWQLRATTRRSQIYSNVSMGEDSSTHTWQFAQKAMNGTKLEDGSGGYPDSRIMSGSRHFQTETLARVSINNRLLNRSEAGVDSEET